MLTVNALPAFIGVTRPPGDALVFGKLVDCAGHTAEHAIVTVNATAGCPPTPLPDAVTYYFSAGSTSLPDRHSQQADSNQDGWFMTIEPAPSSGGGFAQVRGYVDGQTPGVDPIRLSAQVPVPLRGEEAVMSIPIPLR